MYYQYDKSNNDVMEELLDKVSNDDCDDGDDDEDVYDQNDGYFEDDDDNDDNDDNYDILQTAIII